MKDTTKISKTRMSGLWATAFASMVFLSMSACSSKKAIVETTASDVSASGLSDEESAVLNETLDSTPVDQDSFKEEKTTQRQTHSVSAWKGSLKSTFSPGMTEWVVSRGESLGLIAEAVYGSQKDWKKLAALNPGVDANNLKVGQRLVLPGGESSAVADQVEQVEAPIQEEVPVKAAKKSAHSNVKSTVKKEMDKQEDLPMAIEEKPAFDSNKNNNMGAAPVASDLAKNDTASMPSAAAVVAPVAAAPSGDAPSSAVVAPGAMGVVSNDQVPPPGAGDSGKSGKADKVGGAKEKPGNMVKQVEVASDKLQLRNKLLGVAGFFLVLSGVIFVLSRRKSKMAA